MATRDITLQDLSVGAVETFKVTIKKDGAVWDLSAGTVTIVLKRPDRTEAVEAEMSAVDAEEGIFSYTTTDEDLDVPGYWSVSITVVDGTVVKEYPYSIGFYVADQ